jgi:hypothetical protein
MDAARARHLYGKPHSALQCNRLPQTKERLAAAKIEGQLAGDEEGARNAATAAADSSSAHG